MTGGHGARYAMARMIQRGSTKEEQLCVTTFCNGASSRKCTTKCDHELTDFQFNEQRKGHLSAVWGGLAWITDLTYQLSYTMEQLS